MVYIANRYQEQVPRRAGSHPAPLWTLGARQGLCPRNRCIALPGRGAKRGALSPSGGAARRCSALPASILPGCPPSLPAQQLPAARKDCWRGRGLRLYQPQPPRSASEQPALCSSGLPAGMERTAGGVFLMNWGFQRGDGKQAGSGGSAALCEPPGRAWHTESSLPSSGDLTAPDGAAREQDRAQKAEAVCQSLLPTGNGTPNKSWVVLLS